MTETRHETLKAIIKRLKGFNYHCTMLGIGPVSQVVVHETFEACKQHSCPAIFIASRNQVDLDEFGGGYLMGGMDQKKFVDLLVSEQESVGYQGPVYICRDHGGPWQRNTELNGKYPVEKAMGIAQKSFKADIEAGFNCIHIDPTKCPFDYTQDDLCKWTVELMEYCEQVRVELNCCEIDYEVGTEDIQGGLTTVDKFEDFLRKLTDKLTARSLPLPTFIVGQTGTLTRVDCNVGHFDRTMTAQLSVIAAGYGVGFKEHNGDYLSAASCRIHKDIGVTAMNVAPEFGLVETDALLELADLESKLLREGWITDDEYSNLREIFYEKAFTETPWKKWMTDEVKNMDIGDVEKDSALRLLITRVCGHYLYGLPDIIHARKVLQNNVERFVLLENPGKFIGDKVRSSIEFYLQTFSLDGVNAL